MRVFSSRAFNQDVSQAKRLARDEPLFVTDRGRPTHVLLGYEAYRALAGTSDTLIDLLAMEDQPVAPQPDWRIAGRLSR